MSRPSAHDAAVGHIASGTSAPRALCAKRQDPQLLTRGDPRKGARLPRRDVRRAAANARQHAERVAALLISLYNEVIDPTKRVPVGRGRTLAPWNQKQS